MTHCNPPPARGRLAFPWLALAVALLAPAFAVEAGEHDHSDQALTFFLGARGIHRSGELPASLSSNDRDLTADIIIGLKHNRLRYLSEFVFEETEHEFERLQVGFETTENSTFWLGRYHQPASVWNIFYHHGSYLQTSITRPWIEGWEDENGIVPQHVVGALFESQYTLAESRGLHLSAGVGLPPVLLDAHLRPWEQTSHRGVANGSHVALRLEWLPDPVGEDAVGVIASHARLGVNQNQPSLGRLIDQDIVGAFASLSLGRSRLIATGLWMKLGSATAAGASFGAHAADYVQYDFALTPRVTLFARQEAFSEGAESSYVAVFPNTQTNRGLAGLRWELPHKQALSLELSRSLRVQGGHVNEANLQWSAAWP